MIYLKNKMKKRIRKKVVQMEVPMNFSILSEKL